MTLVTKKDVTFTPIGSTGPGGQNVNKNSTGVRAVHNPSGITVVIRTRSLQNSKKKAIEEIRKRLAQEKQAAGDRHRKARWRAAINDRKVIRTYDFKRQEVRDHRTGTRAPLQEVLGGNIGKLGVMMYFEQLRRQALEDQKDE